MAGSLTLAGRPPLFIFESPLILNAPAIMLGLSRLPCLPPVLQANRQGSAQRDSPKAQGEQELGLQSALPCGHRPEHPHSWAQPG